MIVGEIRSRIWWDFWDKPTPAGALRLMEIIVIIAFFVYWKVKCYKQSKLPPAD